MNRDHIVGCPALRNGVRCTCQIVGDRAAGSDRLDRLYGLQMRLNEAMPPAARFAQPSLYLRDPVAASHLLKESFVALVVELVEVLGETNWKPWRPPTADKPNVPRIQEELMDVLHFVINQLITWGVTPDLLMALYEEKHRENMRRLGRS